MSGGRSGMYRREIPENTRFLTFSCYRRLSLFKSDAIKQAFVDHLDRARSGARFRLVAWVIMPEHVHLLLRPQLPENPMSRVLNRLKRACALSVVGRWRELEAPILSRITDAQGKAHFWQRGGGHDRNMRSSRDLFEKMRYIHRNPVTRGLVEKSVDWPWSSARAGKGLDGVLIAVDSYRGSNRSE